jgi:CheY-like chemotaxis protein
MQAFKKDGRITLQTRNIDLTAPTQDRNAALAAGNYVCCEIADNGSGIDAESLPRVFEPFFTTKKVPHRGLGLAWVYGVVTNHGGAVAISSTPEQGTSVRVYLPAEKKMIRDAAVDSASLKGTATVLMVDDEDLLLTMGQAVLSSFGYKVLVANTGQKALDILKKPDAKVDLVITDLVMPGMSGREFVDQARELNPELRVLSTSGYVFAGRTEDDPGYLQKPFTSRELLIKVKHALALDEE